MCSHDRFPYGTCPPSDIAISIGCIAAHFDINLVQWSFRDFELNYYPNSTQYSLDGLSRLTAWLINSELFEQAWSIVCSGPMNWWWSEKLCLFTVGYWTIFLSTEGMRSLFSSYEMPNLKHIGRTHKIPHVWAYMLLGQVVAISVAMNLFYVALSLFVVTQTKSQVNAASKRPVPLILWFSTIASLLTIVYSPYTTPSTFLPNLLTMHAFIVLPLIFPLGQSGQLFDTSAIYTTVIFASVALHLGTTLSTFITLAEHERTAGDFAGRAIDTFFEHPAQTSISWDVICTFVFTAIWEMWASRTSNVGRSELKKE